MATFKFGNGNWAVKDGSVLAYNDDNNNFKPLPFSFTRDSIATRVNTDGLIEVVPNNIPRIDFLNNTSGHLLLEPSRKNNVNYSEDISTYTNFGSTDDVNVAISPDGSQNASSFEGNGVYDQVFLSSPSMTLASAGSYTISVFAKKGTNNHMQLIANGFTGASNNSAYFDLENGTTPTSGAKIENYGNNWYRCSTTVTIDAGGLVGKLAVRVTPSTSDFRWSPISDNVGKSVFVYGFQMEQGSYATSYIPTEGSSVTRSDEYAIDAGNLNVFSSTELSWFLDIEGFAEDGTTRYISISDGGGSPYTNGYAILYRNDGNLRIFRNGLDFADAICIVDIDQTIRQKIAIRFKKNDMKVYINGVSQSLNGSYVFQSMSGVDTMRTNQQNSTSGLNAFDCKIYEMKVWNEALSDSQLQALTS